MTENPYVAPTTAPPRTTTSRAIGELKPLARLTSILKVFYHLYVFMSVVGIAITAFGMTVSSEEFMQEPMGAKLQAYLVVLGIYAAVVGFLFLATVIAHCIWTHRAAHNTRVLGATGHNHSVGWSVGWFFIPLANIIMPYKVAQEIHKSSAPEQSGANWKTMVDPSFLGWWWGLYILTGMLGRASRKLVMSDDPSTIFVGECLDIVSSLTIIAAAVLAVRYITEVCEMQEGRGNAKAPSDTF